MSTTTSFGRKAEGLGRKRGIPILTFRLGADFFGFHIARVKEVVRHKAITRVPRAPNYMPGIINLRGGVVTVVDLAMRFGLPGVADPAEAYIIVVEIQHENEFHLVGLLVDFVQEVIMLPTENLDKSPRIGGLVASHYVDGIFVKDDVFVSLLNLELAFDIKELLAKTGQEGADDGGT